MLFARAVTDSHEAMLDQETGLRGYQATGDARFLEPYRHGQADYRQASARAWELVAGDELRERLRAVQDRADAWRTEHAVPQLTAPPGQAGVPPQAATLAAGKSLFDAYRAPAEQLLAAARSRNSALLQRNAQVNQLSSAVEVALAGAALLLAARRRRHVTAKVTRPVQEVTDVLHRLAAGEETTRPQPYPTRELAELSAGVRALADAAQSRREDADAQKAAAAARARVYEQVLAVAHEFSAYLNPHEIAGALLEALRNLAAPTRSPSARWTRPRSDRP